MPVSTDEKIEAMQATLAALTDVISHAMPTAQIAAMNVAVRDEQERLRLEIRESARRFVNRMEVR